MQPPNSVPPITTQDRSPPWQLPGARGERSCEITPGPSPQGLQGGEGQGGKRSCVPGAGIGAGIGAGPPRCPRGGTETRGGRPRRVPTAPPGGHSGNRPRRHLGNGTGASPGRGPGGGGSSGGEPGRDILEGRSRGKGIRGEGDPWGPSQGTRIPWGVDLWGVIPGEGYPMRRSAPRVGDARGGVSRGASVSRKM